MSSRPLVKVDFNPQDAVPEVLGLIVAASTGVMYGNQCGGLACLYKEVEGYLVVVGRATAFIDFFAEKFDGRPPNGPAEWAEEDLDRLGRMVQEKVFYFVPAGDGDERVPLTLDMARGDLTEAWIPVLAGDDAAVLVFANSD